jgi:nucleoside-diphosphate-sugar epimerase
MKVFITGSNGFIGSNLCRHFRSKGWSVHGLVRRTSDLHFLKGLDVALTYGDLSRPEEICLPDGMDYIVHSASLVSDTAGEEACYRNIYLLAVNLVDKICAAPSRPRRLAYISTALVLGFDGINISETSPGRDLADFLPYVRQKRATEAYVRSEGKKRGLPVVVLRPSDTFGPNDRTTCGRLLRACESGWPLISGRGDWRFGYCYIDNLCQAVELALLKEGAEGNAYTVTNSELPTWRSFLSLLYGGIGRKRMVHIPVAAAFAGARLLAGVTKIFPRFDPVLTHYRVKRVTTETTYDVSRTLADLGYAPDNRMKDQIQAIVRWYWKERRDGYIK